MWGGVRRAVWMCACVEGVMGVWMWVGVGMWSDGMKIVIIIFLPIAVYYMTTIIIWVILFILQPTSISNILILIFYLNNACGICTLLRAHRLWTSLETCTFDSFVCYSCMAHTFSFEWNKEVLDLSLFFVFVFVLSSSSSSSFSTTDLGFV